MGWVIGILLGSAVVLLIFSFFKTAQSKSDLEQQIDHVSFSLMNEVHELQQQVRNIQLDSEITAQQAQALGTSSAERIMLREMLDLYKRGYSIESIAQKKHLSTEKAERMLAPYAAKKAERSMIAQ